MSLPHPLPPGPASHAAPKVPPFFRRRHGEGLCALLLAATGTVLCTPTAWAHGEAPPQGVVSLSASASTEVAKDWLTLTLAVSRDGVDAVAVQSGLKQALDAALKEARSVAKPGQVEVQTGGFSISPRYGSKGSIVGWRGQAEMVVEGRDAPTIAQLSGKIGSMTVSRVGWSLSREAREKAEGDITAEAVSRFRVKIEQLARHFGYAAYALREVNVSAQEAMPAPVFARAAMAAPMAGDGEALPTEAGKATVSVSVNGTVQLTR
jgi:predicted secreted protein